MRIIHYVSWINKRWTDPAFPLNFPWFSTDQYWQELLQSLQQQIINMQAAAYFRCSLTIKIHYKREQNEKVFFTSYSFIYWFIFM